MQVIQQDAQANDPPSASTLVGAANMAGRAASGKPAGRAGKRYTKRKER